MFLEIERRSFRRKEIFMGTFTRFCVLLLVAQLVDSTREAPKSVQSDKIIQHNTQKMNPKLSFQITLHAFLLWGSVGFLMPVGILVIRMSNRVECGRRLKVLFYSHLALQMSAVVLALAAAVLSVINFENSFSNTHQRIGLVLYALILIQPLIGFCRPQRGVRFRSIWYFLHWLLGLGICSLGIVNIYIGLHAFRTKTSKNVSLWFILFNVETSIFVFIYLLQDRWDYMQKQGVILGNEQVTPTDQPSPSNPKNPNSNSEGDVLYSVARQISSENVYKRALSPESETIGER